MNKTLIIGIIVAIIIIPSTLFILQTTKLIYITKVEWVKDNTFNDLDLLLYLHVGKNSLPDKVKVLIDGNDLYELLSAHHISNNEIFLNIMHIYIGDYRYSPLQTQLDNWCQDEHTIKILNPSTGRNLFEGSFKVESPKLQEVK